MSLSTMANWTVSTFAAAVVENLVNTAYSNYRMLPDDNKAQLKRLKTALPHIIAVMGIAEALKMKHPDAGHWVEQFKQALEASEDVLDELEYKQLENTVKNKDEVSGSASSSKKIKLNTLCDDTLKRLKKAVTMLDLVADGVKSLLRVAKSLGIPDLSESRLEAGKILRGQTTSFLAEKEVFGREVEKNKILGWLKRPTDAPLSSFGIVGLGGQGKTTLVQFAYQEILRKKQFDKTIWVCVSTIFSVEDITRKILGELSKCNYCGKSLNAIQESLKKKILSKKVLLVLDDVWDDERRRDWEQLIAPLRFVQHGSKIIFTTRMKSVADLLASVISTEHESLALNGLGEQDLLKLFNSNAFHGFNIDNHRDLQMIGDQILKMLQGSPLAAKVIGSLLNSHMDPKYWSRILNHGSVFNLELAKNVVEVLKLSYYHLPTDLQMCFRFCSIFPQGHLFDKNDLIKMWIASGFIPQQLCQEERPEDIGDDYFNHLLRKSFFEYSKSWEGERYIMHDLMHELARNVSNGECCRVESTEIPITIPSTVRHVFVFESEIDRVSHLRNLRSLVITTSMQETSTDMDLSVLPYNLIKKKLRLLKICRSKYCKLPEEEISRLVHLRYLSIEPHYVTKSFEYSLPASIYKLYHLQVLEFPTGRPPNQLSVGENSSNSEIETTKMTNLLRLRHMKLPEDRIQTIHEIHKLTSLQELTFFVGQESGHCINELRTLNNLRHLSIKKIENILGKPLEAKCANLLGKNKLMSLSLEWTEGRKHNNPEEIIDNLQPHSNLMELTIDNYKGLRSPSWMEESPPLKLSSLKLSSCRLWINKLSPSWQMPFLKILDIYNCVSLDKLPDMPLSLVEFRIDKAGLTSVPKLYQSSGNNASIPDTTLKSLLRVVQIQRCPYLVSLGFLEQENLDLQAVEKLTINKCEILERLPIHGFGNLLSLIYLTLRDSPNLVERNFQGNLLPAKLQLLNMGNCGTLDVPLLKASSALTTLTELQISECVNITSVNASQNSFRYLNSLNIRGCSRLVEISFQEETQGINQEHHFNILKMDVTDCPNLTKFLIKNVAVSALPEYYRSSDSRGSPSASTLKLSLREVEISNCQKLTTLNGFLQQDNIDCHSIEKIELSNCTDLKHLPVGAFEKFVSLKELTIRKCPILVADDNQSSLLPVKLEKLSIANCGELDVPLLKSASNLATLTHLSMHYCANISHIPSSGNVFGSLSSLSIYGCDKLREHSSMIQAHDANQGSNLASLKLSNLDIDHLSLLRIEPLRSLKSVSKLMVANCSMMAALPEDWLLQNSSTLSLLTILNASTLLLLPATMVRLTALKWLEIWKASLLEELPELPASLTDKCIECRRFTAQSGMFTRSYLPFAQSSNH